MLFRVEDISQCVHDDESKIKNQEKNLKEFVQGLWLKVPDGTEIDIFVQQPINHNVEKGYDDYLKDKPNDPYIH